MKLISIIIPTYNRPQMLRRALMSIKTEEKEKIEIIVCDDISTEENKKKNKETCEYVSSSLGIKIIYLENTRAKGVSGARNCAIGESTGEWLLFLDDDDQFTNEYIDIVLSYLSKQPQIDFLWSDILINQTTNKSMFAKKKFIINSENELKNQVITIGISYGVVLRKSCFLECGEFNENLNVGEDTDLILRFIEQQYRIVHMPVFGIIKDESNEIMLSKALDKYAKSEVVDYLLNTYFDFFAADIHLYCAFIKHGNYIYKNQRKYIKNFLFTIKFILKHKQRIKAFKEVIWKK